MPPLLSPRPEGSAAHDELQCWTLTLGDAAFVHQHVVDAWAAQHAAPEGKPIALAFALVGLHLHLDHGLNGREVQRAHMAMAQRQKSWPQFLPLPEVRGTMTARNVLAAPPGPERLQAIDRWCAEVWAAYREHHATVAALVQTHGIKPASSGTPVSHPHPRPRGKGSRRAI